MIELIRKRFFGIYPSEIRKINPKVLLALDEIKHDKTQLDLVVKLALLMKS